MSADPFFNKIAIVTGASSGIGRTTALALAEKGACVALAARRTAELEEVAARIQSLGREALVITTDVTQRDQVERLVQETLSRWGRIDILVSNGGQYLRTPITSLSPENVEQSMAVNFYGGLYSVLAVLPHMLAQKSGHIVLVSTLDGKKGLPPDAPYVAAKSALTGFGDVLRQELRRTGISVTSVFPGRVDTAMIDHLTFSWISPKIPPEAVARAILKGIRQRKAEVYLPFQARLLYFAHVISPPLADWAVRFFRLQGWEP